MGHYALTPSEKAGFKHILRTRIDLLLAKHKTFRAAGEATGIDYAYLCRLYNGDKYNPSDEILTKIGLKRITTLIPIARHENRT